MNKLMIIGWVVFFSTLAWGIDKLPDGFDDPNQEIRYKHLIEELRCVVCQNQSLADSDADLAQNLRDEVRTRVLSGASDHEIKDFLVNRYGDFVLYNPPLKSKTLLLWLGPAILIALAGVIAGVILRHRQRAARMALPPLSEQEQAQFNALIHSPPPDQER